MRTPAVLFLALSLAFAAGCKKKKEGGTEQGGGATATATDTAAAKPAEPAGPQKLTPLPIQMDVPAGATISDTSADAPAVSVSANDCSIKVSTTTDAYASDVEGAKKEIQKDPNPFQKFTREDKTATGWHLEYELQAMGEKAALYGVQVRTKIGDKEYECGTNSRSAAERDCVAKACATLKP
ncbi:MAG TPA: hypothetical protein VK698_38520 [Kofleriaceae bacterium]|nr:hypothetical protein [Kofleriaceae bacterium]